MMTRGVLSVSHVLSLVAVSNRSPKHVYRISRVDSLRYSLSKRGRVLRSGRATTSGAGSEAEGLALDLSVRRARESGDEREERNLHDVLPTKDWQIQRRKAIHRRE